MIEPEHRKVNKWLLNICISHILKLDFSGVKITGNVEPDGRPLLSVPNHFSWWDYREGISISSIEEAYNNHLFESKMNQNKLNPR